MPYKTGVETVKEIWNRKSECRKKQSLESGIVLGYG
jgi:hypothetical protein